MNTLFHSRLAMAPPTIGALASFPTFPPLHVDFRVLYILAYVVPLMMFSLLIINDFFQNINYHTIF